MHHNARRLTVLLACFVAAIGIVSAVDPDDSPPVCSGFPDRTGTPEVAGSASDIQLGDLGISSVTLVGGAINLTLNVDPFLVGDPTVTYTVTQTTGGVDGSGIVLVQDVQGFTCTVAVQFVTLSAGPVSNVVLCSSQGNSLAVTNAVSQPGGTSVCASVLLTSSEPALPVGFLPSPTSDADGCRSLTVDAPITGTTDMEITKDGIFNPFVGFMFSKFNGGGFPAFIELASTVEEGSTKVKAKGGWSTVKMACAEVDLAVIPTLSEWAMLLMVMLLLASAAWVLSRRVRLTER